MAITGSDSKHILKRANIGKWIFKLLEKVFPFLKTKKDLKELENFDGMPNLEILKVFFKIGFVVGFGILFWTEVLSIPIFVFSGNFQK